MLNKIKANIEQMKTLGLDHCKLSTEDEGLTWPEIGERIAIMRECGLDVWVKIGGCEAIGDIRMCKAYGVAGIVAPMIESKYAVIKFREAISKVYGEDFPKLGINLETLNGTVYHHDIAIECIWKDYPKEIRSVTFGMSDMARSWVGLPEKSTIKTIAHQFSIRSIPLTIGGGITPSTVNQVIADYQPDYVQTRNFCFRVKKMEMGLDWGDYRPTNIDVKNTRVTEKMAMERKNFTPELSQIVAIKLALQTEIQMLRYFNQGNCGRIKELEGRLG